MTTTRYLASIALMGLAAAAAQSPAQQSPAQQSPSSPAGAASPHQREVTNAGGTEAQPGTGTDPGSMATPHQQSVTQMPARGAAAAPTFVKMAAVSGMTEVELAKLALEKSSNAEIKQFAERMISDHTKANTELKGIASQKGLDVPTSLDADHAAMVKSMSTKSGKEFDAAYARHMAADHDRAVTLFQSESSDTDKELAAFAQNTLPLLQSHQKMAQHLASMY